MYTSQLIERLTDVPGSYGVVSISCFVLPVTGARDGTMATLTVHSAVGVALGHVTLTYEADVTGDVIQLYGRQLNVACSELVNHDHISPPLLDHMLTDTIFNDGGSSGNSVSARAFELLFESAKYIASGTFMYRFVTSK